MKKILTVLAFVCICSLPAHAQTYSESHLAAAADLVEAANMRDVMDAGMEAMLQSQMAGDPGLRELEPVMRDFFARYVSWDVVRQGYVQLYAERFTEAELREITSFYRSDVGRKLAALTPEMTIEGGQLGERLVQENLGELQAMIMEHLSGQKR